MAEEKPIIRISKNGPYEVSGSVPLDRQRMVPNRVGVPQKWEKMDDFPLESEMYLCRCGHSKNKPFCDDSHLKVGFDGTETFPNLPFEEIAVTFTGPDMELKDARILCASGRFCTREGGVRNLVENPRNSDSASIAKQEAFDCPAGKLVAVDKVTGEMLEPDFSPHISVAEDPGKNVSGPLWVKGGIQLESHDGTKYEVRNRMALCRCGESRNKPFCDGSHIRVGFNDGNVS